MPAASGYVTAASMSVTAVSESTTAAGVIPAVANMQSLSSDSGTVSSKTGKDRKKVVDPWNATPFMIAMKERMDRKKTQTKIVDGDHSELSDLSDGEDDQADFYEPDENESDSATTSDSDDDDVDELPLKKNVGPFSWKIQDRFKPNVTDFQPCDDATDERADWDAAEYFRQYFDELFKDFSLATNINSTLLTGKSLDTMPEEMMTFFGMNLMMSCLGYPSMRMYWDRSVTVPRIAETMSRNRFFKIRSFLKVVIDADISEGEKKQNCFWKIQPVVDRVRQGCLQQQRGNEVSIDEQMIPFTGACPFRQYIPSKPNPVGIKDFVLANPDGLVLDFVLYQGTASFHPVMTEPKLGVVGLVIAHLSETLPKGTRLYCDRFFTGIPLIQYMLTKEIYVTMMKNRVPKEAAAIMNEKELAKCGRGSLQMTVRIQDNKVCIVKWFDNKAITLASSSHFIQPEDTC